MVLSGDHVKVDVIGLMGNGYGGQLAAGPIGLKTISFTVRRTVVSSGFKTITSMARTSTSRGLIDKKCLHLNFEASRPDAGR